ncbi:hypothetical protein V5799_017100 [Amblyomma americanum]|uniref:Gamma-glutamyltransferase n=1 Tax=Amblyomma americanum TaxID=6943 RepID=A0AAQ4F379_AMBAM
MDDADDSSRVIAEAVRARRQFLYGTGSVAATLVGLVALVLFVFYFAGSGIVEIAPSPSVMGNYSRWAVVTDVPACKHIPREVYSKNGTMADAAVATMLCMGVVHPHASGIGGGFVALHYHSLTKRARVLIATESAPRSARRENFTDSKALRSGWKSIGTPSALYGYYALLSELGTRYRWDKLFDVAHYKASEGVEVDEALADAIKYLSDQIKAEDSLKPIFWNAHTKDLFRQGQLLRNPPLSRTLKQLADTSFRSFYTLQAGGNRSLAGVLLDDLRIGDAKGTGAAAGKSSTYGTSSLVTAADLDDYQPVWKDALRTTISGSPERELVVFTAPPPTSGAVLSHILGVMNAKRLRDDPALKNRYALTLANMHYMAESFKYALAKRSSLGDDDYVDIRKVLEGSIFVRLHGVCGLWDLMSRSYRFGSLRMSKQTGVLFNNALGDFSDLEVATRVMGGGSVNIVSESDASRANSMAPFKRPLTSLSPTLVLGPRKSLLALAGAGGLRIPTSLAQVAIRVLWEKKDIKQAIDYPRIHTDVLTGSIEYEPLMPEKLMQKLNQKNHTLEKQATEYGVHAQYSFVTGLTFVDGLIQTNYDYRSKVGGSDGDPPLNLTQCTPLGACTSSPFP